MKKVLATLGLVFMLSGCQSISETIDEAMDRTWYIEGKFEIVEERPIYKSRIMREVRDVDTGVHYFVVYGDGVGITPVIESDGSIRITN